jgi:endoglucanase
MPYPINHFLGWQRNGCNLAGMNMDLSWRATGPVRGHNYPTYSDDLLDWLRAKNVQMVRIPFTWEAVQPALNAPIPTITPGYTDYWADLTDVVIRLLFHCIYVVLTPWGYNPASNDTDITYDGAPFTASQFANFWNKFAFAINTATGNDQRVAFDLMNEPHLPKVDAAGQPLDAGIALSAWFDDAQAAIDSIRAAGATNTILVPGMDWTAASEFIANGSADAYLQRIDPLANLAVTVHHYAGVQKYDLATDSTVLSSTCADLVTWARAHDVKVHVGEIALDAKPSGPGSDCVHAAFATAQAQWDDWHNFCLANHDVIVGWNWWANSAAGGWWSENNSCDGSNWGLTLDDGATQTVNMNLIQATLL